MDDDSLINKDLEELKEFFKCCTKDELCEILDNYVSMVEKEGIIGIKEFNIYITFLTDEINERNKK